MLWQPLNEELSLLGNETVSEFSGVILMGVLLVEAEFSPISVMSWSHVLRASTGRRSLIDFSSASGSSAQQNNTAFVGTYTCRIQGYGEEG